MSRLLLALAAMTFPGLAHAHVGAGDTHGFLHGFAHPLGGFDHVLAMLAVGVIAFQRGGQSLWLVPLSFVGAMVVGGALGAAGMGPPFVEIGIALSIVVLGLVVAVDVNLPTAAATALVGLFAVFHGHAHGAEMPETAGALDYGLGFVLATASLHALGLGLSFLAADLSASRSRRVSQVAGGAMSLAGVGLLTGMF